LDLLDIEENSYLDYNTGGSNGVPKPKNPDLGFKKVPLDDDGYDMITEINANGELILNFELNLPLNHPLLS
jgi:hypothetical protein